MLDVFRTLPGVFDGIEADPAIRRSLVFTVWRRVAGELLSEHTAPVELDETTLVVAVASNTWRAHLSDLCPQMIYKLSTVLGPSVVKYIDLIIDEDAVTAARPARPALPDEETMRSRARSAVTPELRAAADAIGDDELRDKFLLAAGSCIAAREK